MVEEHGRGQPVDSAWSRAILHHAGDERSHSKMQHAQSNQENAAEPKEDPAEVGLHGALQVELVELRAGAWSCSHAPEPITCPRRRRQLPPAAAPGGEGPRSLRSQLSRESCSFEGPRASPWAAAEEQANA